MIGQRRGIPAVATAVLLLVASACTDDDSEDDKPSGDSQETAWEFVSRPDLTPPRIDLTTTDAGEKASFGQDLLMLAPKDKQDGGSPMNGPLIVDADGDPVWVHPLGDHRWSYDLRVQEYRNQPVLTWWRGDTHPYGYGEGEFVLMDQSYDEIATVTTPGTHADFHELTLTPDGTALLISYPVVERDLTPVDGPENAYIRDCVVHEIDVESGKELFRWSMADHVPLTDTKAKLETDEEDAEAGTKEAPFDPYHVNSITEDGNDALLVSARNTHAVYRVDRRTGDLDWTLGGSGSDFEMSGESEFAWQHDAQRQPDGTITLFDNEAAPPVGDESRGLRLEVDEQSDTARVVQEFEPPEERLADSQGNMQVRDDGRVVIGWGSESHFSEYTGDGELLYDAELAGGESYRTYRQPWVGRPTEPPVFVQRGDTAYVSWNGATEVDAWRFVAGYDERSAKEVKTVPHEGFETSAKMPDAAYVGAEALDESGKVLATAVPGGWP